MSTTERVAVKPHHAVQRVGARTGAIHAALWVLEALPADAPAGTVPAGHWRTACGEDLRDGPRGRILVVPTDHVLDFQAQAEERGASYRGPIICRRCARVGDSVSS